MNTLRERGFTSYKVVAEPEIGAVVVSRDGKLWVGEITPLGRLFLEAGK